MSSQRLSSMNALMSAVQDCKLDVIRDSIKRYGLPRNSQKVTDYMVLQKALTIRHKEIAKLLIEAGCRVKTEPSDPGWSPLALAIIMQDIEISRMLIQKRITSSAGNGSTVLHLAARKSLPNMLEFLLRRNIDVNIKDKFGRTALQTLFEEDCISRTITEQKLDNANRAEMIKLLVSKGATLNVGSPNGENILHHAVRLMRVDILCLFLEKVKAVNQQNNNGDTPLHILLQGDNKEEDEILELATILVREGARVDIENKEKHIPLHSVTKKKFYKVLKMFLTSDLNVNICNGMNETILHILLRTIIYSEESVEQEKDIVKSLLRNGARTDIKNFRNVTPMDLAFDGKQTDIISLILENVQDLNSVEIHSEPMLHHLVQEKSDIVKRIEMAKFLLDRGANLELLNESHETPLFIACLRRQVEFVKLFLEYGADIESKDKNGLTILQALVTRVSKAETEITCEVAEILLSAGAVMETDASNQVPLLHHAVKNDQRQMLSVLLKYSTDMNILDADDNTIMHNLLKFPRDIEDSIEKERTDVVALLISRGANFEMKNKNGETQLHLAAKFKHEQISELLIASGADPTVLDFQGNNLLHFLCMLKLDIPKHIERDMVEHFIKHGCEIDCINAVYKTPLLLASQTGCTRIAQNLLKKGADINYTTKDNYTTPLLMAAAFNRANVAQLLIQYGVDVNCMTKDRRTALHYAAQHETGMTKLLLDNGADAEIQDDKGRTALHIASGHSNQDAVLHLLLHGADLNAKNQSNSTPLMIAEGQKKDPIVWTKLMEHAIKLRVAKLFLCQENRHCISRRKANFQQFRQTVAAEYLELETIAIDQRYFLANVLNMNPTRLSIYKNNENFQKILNDEDFGKKFPNYANLIKACYHRGIVRNDLLISAQNILRDFTSTLVPDICCEYIFNFLTNEHLHNFIKASRIGTREENRKKDVSIEEDDYEVPAKKLRTE